jgi:hypothetical protein
MFTTVFLAVCVVVSVVAIAALALLFLGTGESLWAIANGLADSDAAKIAQRTAVLSMWNSCRSMAECHVGNVSEPIPKIALTTRLCAAAVRSQTHR